MANITDASALAFVAGRVKPNADMLAAQYWAAKRTVSEWNARNLSSVIPNTSDVIVDGTSQQLTGIQATAIITRLMEIITDYEAASNAKLNTVLQAAPNA